MILNLDVNSKTDSLFVNTSTEFSGIQIGNLTNPNIDVLIGCRFDYPFSLADSCSRVDNTTKVTNCFSGYIMEILIYSTSLTFTERSSVVSTLTTKWFTVIIPTTLTVVSTPTTAFSKPTTSSVVTTSYNTASTSYSIPVTNSTAEVVILKMNPSNAALIGGVVAGSGVVCLIGNQNCDIY